MLLPTQGTLRGLFRLGWDTRTPRRRSRVATPNPSRTEYDKCGQILLQKSAMTRALRLVRNS